MRTRLLNHPLRRAEQAQRRGLREALAADGEQRPVDRPELQLRAREHERLRRLFHSAERHDGAFSARDGDGDARRGFGRRRRGGRRDPEGVDEEALAQIPQQQHAVGAEGGEGAVRHL